MRKGFTLIELLAVIVILAIIALIATPIILGIINDAREESNERSVELYAAAVKNGIAAYQLREGKEVLPGTYNKDNKLPFEPDYDGKVECENVIISKDGKVSLDKCTVNGGTKEYSYGIEQDGTPSTPVAKACTLADVDDDNIADVGEVVTCNISDTPDKFYVIEEANLATVTEIKMLTEMNIHKTEYRQSSSAGTIAFSSTNYWSSTVSSYPADVYDSNSLLYPIVNEYVSYLNTKLTNATGSLLTYNQAKNLGCDDSTNGCSSAPSWVYSTTYWTGSAQDTDSNRLWRVDSSGDYGGGRCDHDDSWGVRPVITISTSEI